MTISVNSPAFEQICELLPQLSANELLSLQEKTKFQYDLNVLTRPESTFRYVIDQYENYLNSKDLNAIDLDDLEPGDNPGEYKLGMATLTLLPGPPIGPRSFDVSFVVQRGLECTLEQQEALWQTIQFVAGKLDCKASKGTRNWYFSEDPEIKFEGYSFHFQGPPLSLEQLAEMRGSTLAWEEEMIILSKSVA